ncbi:MAG: 50S ribosomal protein L6 [Oscillospiraceae bacterium]|nr:50S ribosomal protein L6 [Oscillospiraceae bacterium]MCL2279145.1 50S ribosomal protein L6 [Oscillospiraceae bacterium]
MSRIGRSPITVPAGVDVKVSDKNIVTVKGPKGTLEQHINPVIEVSLEAGTLSVARPTDTPEHRSLHGLSRSLINNMIIGVTDGFIKELDINGVGYRATKEGKKLVMNLGYSHQVIMDEVEGISVDVPAPNKIIVSGIDKQAVGQFAADVRKKRPPEPYMGKGIKYSNEVIRRKEGKTGVK